MPDGTLPPGVGTASTTPPTQFLAAMDFNWLSKEQRGAAMSVRSLEAEICARGDVAAEDVKASMADLLPPATMFGVSLLALPFFYRDLRNLMVAMGAPLRVHSSRRSTMTLATILYAEAEDRSALVDLFEAIEADGRRRAPADASAAPVAAAAVGPSAPHGKETDRCAHNVAMRFRDAGSMFFGGLGEIWCEYVSEYLQVARNHGFSSAQKLRFLHNLLRGDGERFYLDRVAHVGTFAQAI